MNFNFANERDYETELKQENLRLYQTFKAINKYTKFPIYKAENIKYYKLGDEMFPDILEELKKAQKSIFLEYFIIEPGIFLNSIIDILEQKVKDVAVAEQNNLLSTREFEILQLVAQGMTNREIADFLHLSKYTIECHIKHIYRKLSVSSRSKAVNTARSLGIL